MLVPKIKAPKKLVRKFSQNWVSNSWDIPDMDKFRQDKCPHDSLHLLKNLPLKIFLLRTKIATTKVARTDVTR